MQATQRLGSQRNNHHIQVFTFYVTCVLSGAMEIGGVFWALMHGYPLALCAGMTVAYQLGNVFLFFVTKRMRQSQNIFIIITCLFGAAMLSQPHGSGLTYLFCFAEVALLSTILQTMRSAVKGSEPRWRKRIFRVTGFFSSSVIFVIGDLLFLLIPLLLLILSIMTPRFEDDCWAAQLVRGDYGTNRLNVTMVFHQMHYFVYCYAMLIIAYQGTGSALLAAMAFVGNWIPYIAIEPLAKSTDSSHYLSFFFSGHLFVTMVLVGMYLAIPHSVYVAMGLWVLTGLGGGSVFCIKKIFEKKRSYHSQIWVLSESIGHILGVLVLTGLTIFDAELKITLLLAAFVALTTIASTLVSLNRKR